MFEEERFLK